MEIYPTWDGNGPVSVRCFQASTSRQLEASLTVIIGYWMLGQPSNVMITNTLRGGTSRSMLSSSGLAWGAARACACMRRGRSQHILPDEGVEHVVEC